MLLVFWEKMLRKEIAMEKTLKEMTDQELVTELHKRCSEILSGALFAEDDGFPGGQWPHPNPQIFDVANFEGFKKEILSRVEESHPSEHLDIYPACLMLDFAEMDWRPPYGSSHAEIANSLTRRYAQEITLFAERVKQESEKCNNPLSNAAKAALIERVFSQYFIEASVDLEDDLPPSNSSVQNQQPKPN